MTTTGGCLCGAVRFEVDGPLRDVIVCHCSLCRRAGTSAAAHSWAPRSAIRLVAGAPKVYVDVNRRERSFCRTCGASLFWAFPGGEGLSISAGALDDPPPLRVARHIFAGSAAPWESFPSDVPVHVDGSDSPLRAGDGE
jgi:hypothetical protein